MGGCPGGGLAGSHSVLGNRVGRTGCGLPSTSRRSPSRATCLNKIPRFGMCRRTDPHRADHQPGRAAEDQQHHGEIPPRTSRNSLPPVSRPNSILPATTAKNLRRPSPDYHRSCRHLAAARDFGFDRSGRIWPSQPTRIIRCHVMEVAAHSEAESSHIGWKVKPGHHLGRCEHSQAACVGALPAGGLR